MSGTDKPEPDNVFVRLELQGPPESDDMQIRLAALMHTLAPHVNLLSELSASAGWTGQEFAHGMYSLLVSAVFEFGGLDVARRFVQSGVRAVDMAELQHGKGGSSLH